ncbi:alpha/beta hydrolase [Paraflavitalea pollutisoli]|uniref:alpha/beta hydrolase n=1 Tax=Paraflavitalea pollutisoli TaxID=3034143 RepID=UPI0023EADA42|nr:alpha/beta hydrolase [Paraflavitalea sp. H1-2-19X]
MATTILFIHGMFQNPVSWNKWVLYFESKGYKCQSPAWPFHEGEPEDLRKNIPSELGDLRLETVIDKFAAMAQCCDEPPIVIGHSVGGLIAQVLVSRQLAKAAICISSVAPNRMLAFDWSFLKNTLSIANPLKGDEPFLMDAAGFHANFANCLTKVESDAAFEETATHDSRNILRDCMGVAGEIDMELPHVPLLFIGAQKDEIVPPSLNEKNSKAYKDDGSIADFIEFPHRGHFICGEPGWEEVAEHCYDWLETLSLRPLTLAHSTMG